MITIGDKEITLTFNMKALRAIRDGLGCKNLTEIGEKFQEMYGVDDKGGITVKDLDACIDLAAMCIFHASTEFKTLDEVMELVTDASTIIPASGEFFHAFNQFYGIKGEKKGEAKAR